MGNGQKGGNVHGHSDDGTWTRKMSGGGGWGALAAAVAEKD